MCEAMIANKKHSNWLHFLRVGLHFLRVSQGIDGLHL
jgi:hypothetical protein